VLACRTFQISETCYRYERKFDDENAEIADWLVRLTANRKTWWNSPLKVAHPLGYVYPY
jgi:hypothetical protein